MRARIVLLSLAMLIVSACATGAQQAPGVVSLHAGEMVTLVVDPAAPGGMRVLSHGAAPPLDSFDQNVVAMALGGAFRNAMGPNSVGVSSSVQPPEIAPN